MGWGQSPPLRATLAVPFYVVGCVGVLIPTTCDPKSPTTPLFFQYGVEPLVETLLWGLWASLQLPGPLLAWLEERPHDFTSSESFPAGSLFPLSVHSRPSACLPACLGPAHTALPLFPLAWPPQALPASCVDCRALLLPSTSDTAETSPQSSLSLSLSLTSLVTQGEASCC